jgi:hypothetical protein
LTLVDQSPRATADGVASDRFNQVVRATVRVKKPNFLSTMLALRHDIVTITRISISLALELAINE